MGGVPRRIRFDNLSPAVKKVLPHGKRELTKRFEKFVLHYGFEYELLTKLNNIKKPPLAWSKSGFLK